MEHVEMFEPPERVDDWRIVRRLRHTVLFSHYLAIDEALRREVALTFVLGDLSVRDPNRLGAFVSKVSQLQHPNVVTLQHVGFYESRGYLVTRYVPGGTLRECLFPLPWQQALSWLEQLASGLAALHLIGIVHRNVTPEAVRLSAEGRPVIMEIAIPGIWKDVAGTPGTGPVLGHDLDLTEYRAPEHLQSVSPASDVYALGVLAFELVTGSPPSAHAAPEAELRRWIPECFASVIDRMRASDPGDRYSDGSAAHRALERVRIGRLAMRPRSHRTDLEIVDLDASLERIVVRAEEVALLLRRRSRVASAVLPCEPGQAASLVRAILKLAIRLQEYPDLTDDYVARLRRDLVRHGVTRGHVTEVVEWLSKIAPDADRAGRTEELRAAWHRGLDNLSKLLTVGMADETQ